MSENTNPQVVKFCNEKLRPACDRAISAIRTLRQLTSDYSSDGIGPLVAGTSELQAENIGDNSDLDGRTRILGYDVDLCIGQVTALLSFLDAQSGMEASITKPSANTLPVF